MHPDNTYECFWFPLSLVHCLWLSLSLYFSLTLSFSMSLKDFSTPPASCCLLSPRPPCAFVWLHFHHQTWRFVIVDTIGPDLQRAPSLWTFAVLLLGWLVQTEDSERERMETRAPDQMRQKQRWKQTKKTGPHTHKIMTICNTSQLRCPCGA